MSKPQPSADRSAATLVTLPPAPARLISIDAYRGLVMLLMASEGFRIITVAGHFPQSPIWQKLANHTDHVLWSGCSLWDLIQPSFMFLVGVAAPFSIASRVRSGASFGSMLAHAAWRSALLILLAVFLSSIGQPSTNFIFTNVLAQIGLGYTFLFILGFARPQTQLAAAGTLLLFYWAAWALYPVSGFDPAAHHLKDANHWPYLHHFAAHWDKYTNLGARVDQWFMNLFRPTPPFEYNRGGYTTLNFIPSLATMIFGLFAGGLLRSKRGAGAKIGWMLVAGVLGLALGELLERLGICPIVKRVWTPAWALFSTGWAFLFLAVFYAVIDVAGFRKWTLPLIVVGMNSIAAYVMAETLGYRWDKNNHGFLYNTLHTHLPDRAFTLFGLLDKGNVRGEAYIPIVEQAFILLILWLVCFWMYRRKIFLKV